MNVFIATIAFGVVGLFLGSFVGATVWRLRAFQLREDSKAGEKVPERDKREVRKLKKTSLHKDRSVCLHCGHQLEWFDLVPLVSWVSLRGKCRYCHERIGNFEPIVELMVAAFFASSFLFWPYSLETGMEIARFALWLLAGVCLAILAVYDAKWFLLPNKVIFPLIGIGAVYSLIVLIDQQFAFEQWLNIFYSVLILSGLYYVLYIASRHQWVGFGDIKLGLALALLLSDWRLAILTLFLANVIGTLLVLPMLLSGRMQKHAHIPFGPLLIAGWFIAGLFGEHIINWYMLLVLGY